MNATCLLKRLAASTDLCERESIYWTLWSADFTAYTQITGGLSQKELSTLQDWIQREITRRNLGCILHRTVHSDWEAKIGGFSSLSPEPALALLEAFVAHLEQEQAVNQATAAGGES